jgi:hypothetical protein
MINEKAVKIAKNWSADFAQRNMPDDENFWAAISLGLRKANFYDSEDSINSAIRECETRMNIDLSGSNLELDVAMNSIIKESKTLHKALLRVQKKGKKND